MSIIIMCFYIEYCENESVDDISTIFVLIIDYVNLTLSNHVENIKFFI